MIDMSNNDSFDDFNFDDLNSNDLDDLNSNDIDDLFNSDFDSIGSLEDQNQEQQEDEHNLGLDESHNNDESNYFLDNSDTDRDTYSDADSNQQSPNNVRKTAIFAIICGVILIIVVFAVVNIITGLGDKQPKNDAASSQTTVNSNSNNTNNTSYNQNNSNTISTPTISSNEASWIKFEDTSSEISFNEEYIDSIFTVTNHTDYVKVANDSSIMVKTVLIGALSGYTGTYELEVPYNIGRLVTDGMSFDVEVQIGITKSGQKVIGEIRYN